MKYARRAARWLTLFGAFNPWRGATWALDGSGRAYNVPTLGRELLTNGGFDSDTNWSKGTGWTISGGTANQNGTNVSASYLQQSNSFTVGAYYAGKFDITARSQGATRITYGGIDGRFLSSVATHQFHGRATTASAPVLMTGDTGPTFIGSIDNVSVRPLTTSQLLATITGSSANQTAAAKIHTLTSGAQAGIVSLLDSASNPQNGLFAYHDGTGVTLDKVVNGTLTNLVPRVTVAFSSLAQIEIRRPSGNTFQLWYNGVQRGTNQTVSDAGIISNTIYGLFSTYEGNLFTEFTLDGAVIPFLFPAPAPTFAPTLLADLWAWYDASDITTLYQDSARATPVTSNGDPVGSWGDKSGNARHMLQAGAATLKPTYTTEVQNGLASLSFDGGDYLDTATTMPSFPATIMVVTRTSATVGTNRGIVSNYHSTSFGARVYWATSNFFRIQIATPSVTVDSPSAVGPSTTVLSGGVFDTTTITNLYNGVETTTTHSASVVSNIVSMGRLNVNLTTSLANGHLLEVVIYSRVLTAAELTQIQAYLNTKWAVY